jgi:hypothetical protein
MRISGEQQHHLQSIPCFGLMTYPGCLF